MTDSPRVWSQISDAEMVLSRRVHVKAIQKGFSRSSIVLSTKNVSMHSMPILMIAINLDNFEKARKDVNDK